MNSLLYLLAFVALIAVVNSIMCYQDMNNSQSHTPDKRTVNCTGCSYCLKVYGNMNVGVTKGKAYLWDCGCYVSPRATPHNPQYTCQKSEKNKQKLDDSTIEFDCCSKDKCNSSETLTVVTVIVTVIAAFLNRN